MNGVWTTKHTVMLNSTRGDSIKTGAVLFRVRTMEYGLFQSVGATQRVGTPLSAIVYKWVGTVPEWAEKFRSHLPTWDRIGT